MIPCCKQAATPFFHSLMICPSMSGKRRCHPSSLQQPSCFIIGWLFLCQIMIPWQWSPPSTQSLFPQFIVMTDMVIQVVSKPECKFLPHPSCFPIAPHKMSTHCPTPCLQKCLLALFLRRLHSLLLVAGSMSNDLSCAHVTACQEHLPKVLPSTAVLSFLH